MKGSLIIVSFFIVGTFCGVYHLIPYEFTHSNLSYYALCGLMFCVGISVLLPACSCPIVRPQIVWR